MIDKFVLWLFNKRFVIKVDFKGMQDKSYTIGNASLNLEPCKTTYYYAAVSITKNKAREIK